MKDMGKGLLAIVEPKPKGEDDEDEAPDSGEYDTAKNDLAKKLVAAISEGDSTAVASHLEKFIHMCSESEE